MFILIILLKTVKKTNAITISILICSQLLNNLKQYIGDCVKISHVSDNQNINFTEINKSNTFKRVFVII
jgi:hypothetical protein